MDIARALPGTPADRPIDSAVDPTTDAILVRQVVDGSHDALAILYDRHASAVFAAAFRAGRDRWVAAEIVQETFLALWNRAEQFDPTRGSIRSWLLTIARNRAVDHFRAAGRHDRATVFSSFSRAGVEDDPIAERLTASGELIGAAGPEPTPEDALADKEARGAMAAAIETLSPVEQSVIVLAYEGGLTQSEIAARLGWPIGTVKTRTRRALHNLRSRLEAPPPSVPRAASNELELACCAESACC
jgi:RNA polymerase sigma-70 factor (ECF subfamily)